MTLKKLTLAAAIAVGIATCSFTTAMAACPCSSDNSVSKMPCKTCPQVTTPENARCPISQKDEDNCGCDEDKNFLSSTCPSPACSDLDMKQVYSYPNAVYGENNYVGEESNSIYSTHTPWTLDGSSISSRPGVTVASEGQLTGAAANACGCNENLPIIQSMNSPCGCGEKISGVDVSRDCCKMDSAKETISIETESSLDAIKKSFLPVPSNAMTGAAAPLSSIFPDVPQGYWAGCDINRLATTDVIAGYPDRTFKPSLPVTRAEFASMLVRGFNLDLNGLSKTSQFKDVSTCHWANPAIAKAVEDGIMRGYCGGKFMPEHSVTRVEALTALSHGINCEIDQCKANTILSQYCDGDKVPNWAQIPVAKALEAGVLKDSPEPTMIKPNKAASRADIASMLQNVRVAAGYDKAPIADTCDCNKKAYMESEEIVKIPTLKLEFLDQINAKSSHVGQQFATTTLEEVTINGKIYPVGSRVNGKIVEVIRPSGCQKGALKLAFTTIEDCDGCKANLPRQILNAQINCAKNPNPVARLVTMPFTVLGSMAGIVGRTTGGMLSNTGNAVESLTNGTGIALGETFQGQFKAAGRSLQDATKTTLKAPIDFTRTALSGTMGLFQTTGDEVAYLVDPKGQKISAVNPKEHITIAFGCQE